MPDVKMDYQQMEDMTNAFKKAQSDVQNSMNALKGTASKLAEAFQGDGGSALQDAINKILLKKMDTVAQKMGEVAGDLKTAEEATKQASLPRSLRTLGRRREITLCQLGSKEGQRNVTTLRLCKVCRGHGAPRRSDR